MEIMDNHPTLGLGLAVIMLVVAFVSAPLVQPSSAAQSPTAGTADAADLRFDVASIKPNNSGARGSRGAQTPGRFSVTNTTVFNMIQTAYGIRDVQVIGGPGWIKTNHYDINANRPANATRDQLPGMMRNLLADRFALKVHHEARDLQAANLVMVRSDRRLGPHLQAATDADAMCGPAPAGFDFSKGLPPCSLQDQLGLKLEFRKDPVDVIVIDRIEPPTPD